MKRNRSNSQKGTRRDGAEREQRILDAAARLFCLQGYDKTTVEEIAVEAGISKGAIYLHFRSKDELFEALLKREAVRHGDAWLERMEADPEGGTLGGIYRAVLASMHASELITAIYRQDQRILGTYLKKPGNLFGTARAQAMRAEFVEQLQAAGVVRRDVGANVISHLLDVIGYGMAGIGEIKAASSFPPLEDVFELLAEMLDRSLAPAGGADSEAGKRVIRERMVESRRYLEEFGSGSEAETQGE